MLRETWVYIDLDGVAVPAGRLWSRVRGGRESASFQYDESWLRHPQRFALEPALALGAAAHHTPVGKAFFWALGDSASDRWGRILMTRAERQAVRNEARQAAHDVAAGIVNRRTQAAALGIAPAEIKRTSSVFEHA